VAQHDALISEIDDQCERLLRRTDNLKKFLANVRLDTQGARWKSEDRDARALAVVCTIAELEAFTKFLIQETHLELNKLGLPLSKLQPNLRQIAAHTTFESLRELSDHSKLWGKRRHATTLEACNDPAEFPVEKKTAQPPLDGKTLKPEHFNRVWEIYGLSGISFPMATWSASLQKMALIRNDVAHGNMPFHEIFQQGGRTVREIEGYVDDIGEFAIHLSESWAFYLRAEGYRIP
jgi:hypothetical protein